MTIRQVSVPSTATTTPQLVAECAARFAAQAAVVHGTDVLSFEDLHAAVTQVAQALVATGLQPGDRIGILAPNDCRWIVSCLGAHAAGCVVVPINTRFKRDELIDVLQRSGARLLMTVAGFLDMDYVGMVTGGAEGGGHVLPDLQEIVLMRGSDRRATAWREFCGRAGTSVAVEQERRARAVRAGDVADIMFTSGTSGRPKGVMIGHGQMLDVYRAFGRRIGLRAGDRSLVIPPFFHTFGYRSGFVMAMLFGSTTYPMELFDPDEAMRLVEAESITVLPGPPAILGEMIAAARRGTGTVSSLRLVFTGGADVSRELIQDARDVLACDVVVSGYGMTESTGCITLCGAEDDVDTVARTSGRPLDGVEVRLVDESGASVAPGEAGEVLARGHNVMLGYWADPTATADAVDADGWLHTGDVGFLDDRGYFTFVERRKDVIIVGGFNAYPAEIERVLVAHPAVRSVALIGVPDARLGEVGMAFVVPEDAAVVDGDELIAWARERMANYKAPRYVRVVDELPSTALGKVRKNELRELAKAAFVTETNGWDR